LDGEGKKYITESDVKDFLADSKVQLKGGQLKTLFGRIDVNHNEAITLREFQNFILPNQNPKLRYETVRRSVFIPKPHEKLCKEIEYFATKLFTEIIKQYTTYALSYLDWIV
jgi:hypothetical protein